MEMNSAFGIKYNLRKENILSEGNYISFLRKLQNLLPILFKIN